LSRTNNQKGVVTMFNNRIIKSITGALGIRLFFVLAIGTLLVFLSSLTALARSFDNGLNLRTNNAVPTTRELEDSMVYLPLMVKNFPFIPDAPVLDVISNTDGDGNYTVSWSSSEGADTYTLEEDDNAGFSNTTTIYSGPVTSTIINGKDVGTYYYRVKGSNAYANSGWSNTRSVVVTVPSPGCPRTGQWSGITSQGYPISFMVENSPQCQIEYGSLSVRHSDNCGIRTIIYKISIPITNNHFAVGYSSNGVEGSFSSSSTAAGTFAFEYPDSSNPGSWCRSSGTWTAPTNAPNDHVSALAVQADGKILVGGSFTTIGGQPRDRIARLNPDGTLDTAFNPGANGSVGALAVQADGKIVVGGSFSELGGQPRGNIGRLNPDGTLDAAFNPGEGTGSVRTLVVQADGKIVVGGSFTELGGQPRDNIARLNANGTLDAAFDLGADDMVRALAVQADGKILVGGNFGWLGGQPRDIIARLNSDGTLDNTFNPGGGNGWVSALAVQADGKIVAGGAMMVFDGQSGGYMARLNPNGSLDTAYNPGANGEVHVLAVQADSKIVAGGSFSELGGQPRGKIGRLNTDGTLDATFNPGANNIVFELAVQADGKILVGGWFTWLGGQYRSYFGRVNPDGTLDATFP
jgi:uncharacterized delta-60 repeat protein